MPLSTGTRLGAYQVLACIGVGGMGEVYRATDTKLKRDVALKVLPEAFARDAERMARFQREAEVLAALNHPNIAAIYGIEDSTEIRALVMELVEGPTLAERIKQAPILLDEAVHIAKQIADGVEYAHEKTIVHRDLKPANVKITPEGVVKILDFGLAKAFSEDPPAPADPSNAPTLTMGKTRLGAILGTPAYMAPEQARGIAADKRADIWAFGVVLYEMLTGKRLFKGRDTSEILAAVIKEEPHWDSAPERARPLLRRCLEKDPRRRLRDMGDAMPLLEEAAAPRSSRQSRRAWLAWGAGGLLFVTAAAALPFAVAHLREKPPAAAPVRFEVAAPSGGSFGIYLALSPDGRRLAFTGTGADGVERIWVRDLDAVEARPIEGTENPSSLMWSPDSRFIAFGAGNQLKKVDVAGGPPVTLCDSSSPVGSGAWSKRGVIVFGGRGSGPLQKVSEAGGVPGPLTALDSSHAEAYHSFPSFLEDGTHFVYYRNADGANQGIYAGSLDAKPNEQPARRLLGAQFDAVYAPSPDGGAGRLLFLRDGTLMAQPFDSNRLELSGEPGPVAERVGSANQYGNYSVSSNGALAYRAGGAVGGSELVWMDRSGKRLGAAGKPGQINGRISFEALSPDGKTVAFVSGTQQRGSDIWLYDLGRGTLSRFTFGPGVAVTPIWSPDSSRIAYGASPAAGSAAEDIYQKPASGAAKEELLLRVGHSLRLYDWSRDGKTIVYVPDIGAKTKADLWLLPTGGDHKPSPYLQTQFGEYDAEFSPDGRWMAYTSDESGAEQVYVQPVPPTGAKWQISTAGGSRARWRGDGKELFYMAADRKLMAVPVKASATLEAGIPQPLFASFVNDTQKYQFFYTPSADGQKFLMKVPAGADAAPPPITIVLNWQAASGK